MSKELAESRGWPIMRGRVTREHCAGCCDNFYNGNNEYGIQECWSLKDAVFVMKKAVHINQVPPWTQKAEKLPSCYRAQKFIYVRPETTQ